MSCGGDGSDETANACAAKPGILRHMPLNGPLNDDAAIRAFLAKNPRLTSADAERLAGEIAAWRAGLKPAEDVAADGKRPYGAPELRRFGSAV